MEIKVKQGLEIKVAIQILKPANMVFEAIINPEKMTNYFISKSSGKMMEGKIIIWKFPEFETEFPIHVEKIEQDRYISYHWESESELLLVEKTLDPIEDNATVVTVTEKSRDNDEAGIQWLGGNSAGGANFLACLKRTSSTESTLEKVHLPS